MLMIASSSWAIVYRLNTLMLMLLYHIHIYVLLPTLLGDAFSGFNEPMPCFPPSYKRLTEEKGDCGDYTDSQRVFQGYNNPDDAENPLLSETNVEEVNKRKSANHKKLRPPSYTDRILVHSLKDRQKRLAVQAYDFCDTLRASDHRAVTMTVLLEVHPSLCVCLPI